MHKLIDFEIVKNMMQNSDKILVGVGDDFEMSESLNQIEEYRKNCNEIANASCQWVMPYVNAYYLRNNDVLKKAYKNLNTILADRDYFIISTSMNGMVHGAGLSNQRIVEPCGSYKLVQVPEQNGYQVIPVEPELIQKISDCINGKSEWIELDGSITFNSLYSEPYCESGYQVQWQAYTKWLQETLNKKLCILELGSSMMFASVLRFRFEKMITLNKKANLIRINKRLYQIPEEISDRGYAADKNAVEFMANLSKI